MENKRRPKGDRNENSEGKENKPERKGRDQRLSGERRPRVIRDDQKKTSERPYRRPDSDSDRRSSGDRPRYGSGDRDSSSEKRPYRRESNDQGRRSSSDRDKRSGSDDRRSRPERKPYSSDRPERKSYGSDRPERKPYGSDRPERKSYGSDRPERKPVGSDRPEKPRRSFDKPERKPYSSDRPDRPPRSFDKPERRFGDDERKPRPEKRSFSSDRPEKRERSFDKPERRFGEDEEQPRPERKQFSPDRARKTPRTFDKPDKRFSDESKPRPYRTERYERPERSADSAEDSSAEETSKPRPYKAERPERPARPARSYDKPENSFGDDEPKGSTFSKPERKDRGEYPEKRPYKQRKTENRGKPARREKAEDDGSIRLNKYIANSGICSRREADNLIEAGAISINGVVVTELGTKVQPTDKIKYGDQTLSREKPRYVLLNKPKGFITTTDDPDNRKTVMNLVAKACRERIYPIGRLDRNTTGLLLFTNDGDMAKKLAHPRYGIKKTYHVVLDRNLTKTDMKKISDGLMLDDGITKVDAIEYITEAQDKKEIGIELHSGKNRVVRRIFETLDYKVVRLDRVVYAGLTKKNLPRGEWRFLEQKEINMLKIIS